MHILAQPNLTAISGEAASFLVGGEFPIPVAQQNNQVTIEFKQFGVSLAFVPTVASDGQITLKVGPRSASSPIRMPCSSPPAHSTHPGAGADSPARRDHGATRQRREFRDRRTAAGLRPTSPATALPIMGDVPILGALFRSDNFQRNETELVIVVTPYLVRPVAQPAALHLPTDGWQPPSDLERILLLRQSARQTGIRGSEPGVAAHPRQCRIHRAMTEMARLLSRQLLCLAALCCWRAATPPIHIAAKARGGRTAPTRPICAPWWSRHPISCEASRSVSGNGQQAAAALDRYRNDKVRPLPDSAVAKILPVAIGGSQGSQ